MELGSYAQANAALGRASTDVERIGLIFTALSKLTGALDDVPRTEKKSCGGQTQNLPCLVRFLRFCGHLFPRPKRISTSIDQSLLKMSRPFLKPRGSQCLPASAIAISQFFLMNAGNLVPILVLDVLHERNDF